MSTNQPSGDPYRDLLPLLDARRFDEAIAGARLALEGDLPLLTRVRLHNLLCWSFAEGLRKTCPEAVLHGQVACQLALASGDLALTAQCHLNSAMARFGAGDLDGAWRDLEQVEAWLTEMPGLVESGPLVLALGQSEILRVRGEEAAAEARLRQALEHCGPGDDFFVAEIHRRLALLRIAQERPEAALALLDGLLAMPVPYLSHSMWWKTHCLLATCRTLIKADMHAAAQQQLPALLALARELGDEPAEAQALAMAALLAAPQDQSKATSLARQAMNVAVSSGRRDVVLEITAQVAPWVNTEI